MNIIKQNLLEYLFDATKNGARYFKSRHIAEELGLSSKEVGVYLGMLLQERTMLKIERWGYSNGTTWRIEPR